MKTREVIERYWCSFSPCSCTVERKYPLFSGEKDLSEGLPTGWYVLQSPSLAGPLHFCPKHGRAMLKAVGIE